MATNELQKKMSRAATLRENIAKERGKRQAFLADQQESAQSALLDQELARLEAELAAEKAQTSAQKKAIAPVGGISTADEARRIAEAAEATASRIATKPEQLTAEDSNNTPKEK